MTAWNDLTWPQVRAAVDAQPWALLTLGAVEEHGPHLPLGTDTMVARSFSTRLAQSAGLLELPTMPYGQVWSLKNFDGSLSISDTTLMRLIMELADGLQRVGVRGLVLFSAHLGNVNAMKAAVRRLAEDGGLPALSLAYPGLNEIAEQVADSPRSHPHIMHADELETSVMLALHPQAVNMDAAVREYPDYPQHFDAASLRWDAVNASGVFGDATAATADKGSRIVDHVLASATSIIGSWRDSLR
ncbi:MAG: creatininase family protein [Beutenbergiaceae bacterium]